MSIWLPFGTTEKRDSVFADLAASDKPRRAIAFYGLASVVVIVSLAVSWLWFSHFVKTNFGLELRGSISSSSNGGVSLPTFSGVAVSVLWIALWVGAMRQIRRLAVQLGRAGNIAK